MRKLMLAALVAALGLTLCACQDTGEVENQAYVLVLGLDRTDGDALTLTACVPRIGNSGTKGDTEEPGNSPYLFFSVSAPSWSQSLDALQWATPRRINLSHIGLIVVSEELASLPAFSELMRAVADTPHLYANARFVVCSGSARAFVEAGETIIGTRLSSEIQTMLSQYARQGFIPEACLADACYCANGIYGDPIAIWGELEDEAGGNDAVAITQSPMRQRFSGTALFYEGRYIHALSKHETRLLNLVREQGNSVVYPWRGDTVELSPESTAREVLLDGDDAVIALRLKLRTPAPLSQAERMHLEASVADDVARLIGDCQRLGCDPFGFAESAAIYFPTVPQWLAFDWRGHYRRASLSIDVTVLST